MVSTPVQSQTTTSSTQVKTVLTVAKIASGTTQPGATNWQKSDTGIYVDVDTSAAGFTKTPIYVTSIAGDKYHWGTTGASSVYNPTPTSFRISIRWEKGFWDDNSLDIEEANSYKWHINWIAIEPFSDQGQATTSQPSSTTAQKTPFPDPQKYYYIGNKKCGKYIDVYGHSTADGGRAVQYQSTKTDNQRWQFQDAGDGYHYIVGKESGKVLAVANSGSTADGAKIIQWTKTANADDQKWKLEDAGDGYYYIVNKKSSKVIAVGEGGSTADAVDLVLWPKDANANDHKWKLEAV